MKYSGGCLCGAVTYTVSGLLRPVINCHCQQCRKTSGHFVAATSAPRDSVNIVGHVTWFRSSDTARRGFCATCGSNLFWDGLGENLSIFAGTLDNPSDLQTKGHIFVDDKGAYYDITDDLPKAPQDDAVLTTVVKP
ncbi:MAG: GFA family protein [Rhodobacteraceae bacterium]|nr:GFA family protein [Paracoccaceae bacterium]